MNRRWFITSAFKATAAGLLVPEHLWGRSMVAGFRAHPKIHQMDIDLATSYNTSLDKAIAMISIAFGGDTHRYWSTRVMPNGNNLHIFKPHVELGDAFKTMIFRTRNP